MLPVRRGAGTAYPEASWFGQARMTIDPKRRIMLSAMLATPLVYSASAAVRAVTAQGIPPLDQLAALERRHGGRLGVAILDTTTGRRINHRGEERFAMCSTFKWLLAAQVLARVDRGEESLDRRIVVAGSDIVSHSPVTEQHIGEPGMTVDALCEAAVTRSDNAAANLLLASGGGPEGFTAFARSIGDTWTRLDRIETALNEATPGDPRDTTTPAAMLRDLQAVLLGDVLKPASRERLVAWLVGNRTGDARLRAGLPDTWRVGDKTGSGGHSSHNDVGIAWPPGRAPLLVTAYYAEAEDTTQAQRDAVLADVGRILAGLPED